MSGLVDWRTPMDYSSYNDGKLQLTHTLGHGMFVQYVHGGNINKCGAWITASGQNALRERESAIKWFDWAKNKPALQVLESAIEDRYCIKGYSTLKHARLLREAGRIEEAKKMVLYYI